MTKKLFPFFLLIVAFGSIAAGPQLLDGRWERAYQAWDSGDYITALREFDAFLKEPDADRWFERIALITGELYQVQEVAPDGRSPRFSSSGRYVAFETGTVPDGITNVVDVEIRFHKEKAVSGGVQSFSLAS